MNRVSQTPTPAQAQKPVWRYLAGEWQQFPTAAAADAAQRQAERDYNPSLVQTVCSAAWRMQREL